MSEVRVMAVSANRRLKTLGLIAALAFARFPNIAQAQSINIDAAKKEGKVVVYGTVVPQVMDVINKGFEKRYGIQVEYWRASSTQVLDRTLNEWRAGRPGFDVAEAARVVQVFMRKEGLFGKYLAPSTERFPERFKEKDGLITAWRALPIGILYNTELVKVADLPKTFDDLLDPKWKKKISMPDPTQHATTTQFLWNLEKIKGEKWIDFVKALAKQEPHLVESLAPVANAIIRGEAYVGIAYIKYVQQYKGPISYVAMDKYLTEPSYLSLSGKANNPNAGKLYIDYACSAEGQRAVAEDGEFVFYPGIYPRIRDAEKVAPNMIFMDNATTEEFEKLKNDFRKIFFAK